MIKVDKIEERFPRQNRIGRSVMQEISPENLNLKMGGSGSPDPSFDVPVYLSEQAGYSCKDKIEQT